MNKGSPPAPGCRRRRCERCEVSPSRWDCGLPGRRAGRAPLSTPGTCWRHFGAEMGTCSSQQQRFLWILKQSFLQASGLFVGSHGYRGTHMSVSPCHGPSIKGEAPLQSSVPSEGHMARVMTPLWLQVSQRPPSSSQRQSSVTRALSAD